MKKINLGVNIDHVATIRNARGEWYPEPLQAALVAQKRFKGSAVPEQPPVPIEASPRG